MLSSIAETRRIQVPCQLSGPLADAPNLGIAGAHALRNEATLQDDTVRATWTLEVLKIMDHIPFILGNKATILGTLEV